MKNLNILPKSSDKFNSKFSLSNSLRAAYLMSIMSVLAACDNKPFVQLNSNDATVSDTIGGETASDTYDSGVDAISNNDAEVDAGIEEPDMEIDMQEVDTEADMQLDAEADMQPDEEADMEPDMEPTEDMGLVDSDNDGVADDVDNCPADANPDQTDLDNDGAGDACDDEDNRDTDNDGVDNFEDNCPADANPDQTDLDNDGAGDVCDDEDNRDTDNDGVDNFEDNCPADANPDQTDLDNDGTGDACDDSDGDGVADDVDECVTLPGGNVDESGCCVTVLSNEIDSNLPENPIQVGADGSFVLSSRMFFDSPLVSPIFELGSWNAMVVTEDQVNLIFTFLNQDTDNRHDSFIAFSYNDSNGSLNVYRTNRSSLMNHNLTGVTFYAFSGPVIESLTYDPLPGSTGLTLDGCGEVSHRTFQDVERLMNRMFPTE